MSAPTISPIREGRSALATLGAILCAGALSLATAAPLGAQWSFIRGDANGDGTLNIADPVATLGHLFQGAPSPCPDSMDANDDGSVNIADAVFSLDVLFGTAGQVPPAPYPACGDDPTADAIACPGPLSGCPSLPTACGTNGDCSTVEYCEKAIGDCGGVGTCAPMPMSCPTIFDPVCGCDGVTYTNACSAAQAGVSIDFTGSCVVGGCTSNGQCPPGEYCQKAVGDCNGVGNCAPMPFICPLIFDPVCGCDGLTYSNSCFAASAGMNIEFLGPCP